MTTPATRYLSFTYFETIGVYRGADTLGQIGNFLTNTYLPLKDRVRLGNDGSETLDTHNYVLNYLEQGAFHFIVPFLVRGVFFPDYEFVAKTLFASCVASAIACTIIGIICLQMSTTQQDAFEAYIQKQWLDQPASSFISKSPKFIAQFLPTNKAHDVLKDVR